MGGAAMSAAAMGGAAAVAIAIVATVTDVHATIQLVRGPPGL
jgi:hypothetical protein